MSDLLVDLGDRSYSVVIKNNLFDNPKVLTDQIKGKQVCVVTNTTVGPLYLDKVLAMLDGFNVDVVTLNDGEQYKTLDSVNDIFTHLLSNTHSRKTTLIALGGGVVGDMTGYAAASYQRGVDFIQIPTTLLSQVDSSVGGKTGVNHPLGKNMIGAFKQPNIVLANVDTLQTLSDRELSAGISEVIKYGLLYDEKFLTWLEENMQALVNRDNDALTYAIFRSCEIKAEIVAQDEKESGIRALLNLGHTFGHAIETTMGYGQWLHGEAVATGMVMAAHLSLLEGDISKQDFNRVVQIIQSANLPVNPPESMAAQDFVEKMSVDKKVIDGQLRLVLFESIGKAILTDGFNVDLLQKTLTKRDFA